MAEEKLQEKQTDLASPEPSPVEQQGEQETGVLEAVDITTPNVENSPPRPRSRVRFEEDEHAPEKPPRPMSPGAQALITLIEAFPSIDVKVVKAVLVASRNQIEPAFNALLGMSDPDFTDEQPPPQPPRPTAEQRQLQQDEMYARQLAEHYNARGDRRAQQPRGDQPPKGQRKGSQPLANPDEKEYSFFDDELPEIRENLRQGFIQTQSKVNKWITDFRKRIDGEPGASDDYDDSSIYTSQGQNQGSINLAGPERQNFGSSQAEQLRGIRKSAERDRARRSTDHERYDADPRVLSGDFADLELRDEETPPRKPVRPLANPDLFKPTPPPPQSGPVDEVDALYRPSPSGAAVTAASRPSNARQLSPTTSGGKSKKWQPLTSVAPAPVADGDGVEEEEDPFSVGDSDDELREAKSLDVNEEATARLKRAASVTNEGKGKGREGGGGLERAERSGSLGTRDKTAEDLMNG